jgi:hypothetical protein
MTDLLTNGPLPSEALPQQRPDRRPRLSGNPGQTLLGQAMSAILAFSSFRGEVDEKFSFAHQTKQSLTLKQNYVRSSAPQSAIECYMGTT